MLLDVKYLFVFSGNCHVPPIVRSQQWKLLRCENKARCPACWLKMCLKAFQVPPNIRAGLTAMLPTYMRANSKSTGPLTQVNPLRIGVSNSITGQPTFGTLTNSSNDNENKTSFISLKANKKVPEEISEKTEDKNKKLIEAGDPANDELNANRKQRHSRVKVRKKDKEDSKSDKQVDDSKRQKVELKGPRVKHVCRSASIVLGQPIATFPIQEEKDRDKTAVSSDDDISMLSVVDKVNSVIDTSNVCEKVIEIENKAPERLTVPEGPIAKDDTEVSIEPKKRKVEVLLPPKPQSKGDLSEDESVLELVPRKAALKPLTNITNVSNVILIFLFLNE